MLKRLVLIVTLFLVYGGFSNVLAQENVSETFEAKVINIPEEKKIEIEGQEQLYQKIELLFLNGSKKDQKIIVENGNQALANVIQYKVGNKVIVTQEKDIDGNEMFTITDFVRRDALIILLVIFAASALIIGRWKGLASFLSMGFTFWILMAYILPKISIGEEPIKVAVISSLIIIPISFYLSHGLNRKTTVAILGSIIALVITMILSIVFINMGNLTGLASEEAGMFLFGKQGFDMKGLLLAGIIIGALGILDDITVSQAAIVQELMNDEENPKKMKVYKQAMNVGRDHISSMVNTLILAYAGVSLPLLLIFVNNPHPFSEIINYEFLAEEIIRTLIGSIGLVLAVPITTLIAVNLIKRRKK